MCFCFVVFWFKILIIYFVFINDCNFLQGALLCNYIRFTDIIC